MPVISATPITESQLDAVLKALASSQRREIIRVLTAAESEHGKSCCANDEVCGCRLSDRLGLAASTISHHMSILRAAGLVTARKDGTWVYYSLQHDVLRAAAGAVESL